MLKLGCAHLISLHRRQAQTDKDGVSNHKIDLFTQYKEILNLEMHKNCIIALKSYGHFAEFD